MGREQESEGADSRVWRETYGGEDRDGVELRDEGLLKSLNLAMVFTRYHFSFGQSLFADVIHLCIGQTTVEGLLHARHGSRHRGIHR